MSGRVWGRGGLRRSEPTSSARFPTTLEDDGSAEPNKGGHKKDENCGVNDEAIVPMPRPPDASLETRNS